MLAINEYFQHILQTPVVADQAFPWLVEPTLSTYRTVSADIAPDPALGPGFQDLCLGSISLPLLPLTLLAYASADITASPLRTELPTETAHQTYDLSPIGEEWLGTEGRKGL